MFPHSSAALSHIETAESRTPPVSPGLGGFVYARIQIWENTLHARDAPEAEHSAKSAESASAKDVTTAEKPGNAGLPATSVTGAVNSMAKGDGKNKYGHPLPYKPQPPLKNVCSECNYHNSHSPTCSKNPNNQKK